MVDASVPFVSLPLFLKQGLNFYFSMGLSMLVTVACYWLMVTALSYFGVEL